MKKIYLNSVLAIFIIVLFTSCSVINIILGKKFKVIETSSTVDTNVDIVYRTLSIDLNGANIDSFSILGDTAKQIEGKFALGYDLVYIDAVKKLYDYFSVEPVYTEIESRLGQYCFNRNFNGVEILVFYSWHNPPHTLSIVIIKDDTVNIISEAFENEDMFPRIIKPYENGAVLLLRGDSNFEIRKIDLKNNNNVTSASFKLPGDTYEKYTVDMVYADNKLYLMTNETDITQNGEEDIFDYKSHLFTYDMVKNTLSEEKVSDTQIDFLVGNKNELYYGGLTEENTLDVYRVNLSNKNTDRYTLKCPDNVSSITSNSVIYDGSYLYINLGVQNKAENQPDTLSVLYMYDLDTSNIVNRYLYSHDGAISVYYYEKGTNYKYNLPYSIAS